MTSWYDDKHVEAQSNQRHFPETPAVSDDTIISVVLWICSKDIFFRYGKTYLNTQNTCNRVYVNVRYISSTQVPVGFVAFFPSLVHWLSFYSSFDYLSCSPFPPSILCSSALTALDSWRWNRNFDIKHLHKGGLTFDHAAVWCCDIKFASWEPWQQTLPQRANARAPSGSCEGQGPIRKEQAL